MASPSVTYTFSNSTTADASQVNQNFTDIINGLTDGTKDLSISALTCAGNTTFNGNTVIGNAASDTFTLTAVLSSSIAVGTTFTYDLGATGVGLRDVYFGSADSAAKTTKIRAGTVGTSNTLTLPIITGTLALYANPVVTVKTTGTAQTHSVTSGCKVLRVRMAGGGGGGSGSGTASGGNGGNGGNSTVTDGSTTLTAAGGTGGTWLGQTGGAGGAATVGMGSGSGISGETGGGSQENGTGAARLAGGYGGNTPYFNGRGISGYNVAGTAAITNTGGGGGGGGTTANSNNFSGAGGGSGAFIDVLITSPAASYTYSVGAAGSVGTAGTNGNAGGLGAAGVIIFEEYFG